MKFNKIFMAMLAIASLSSCSDSNDDEPANAAAEVAGSYQGYSVANARYFQNMVAADETVTVTAGTSTDEVAVRFVSDTFGTIIIPAAKVAGGSGSYTLSGAGTAEMGMEGNKSEYVCSMTGTISGGRGEFKFSCPAVMGGLTIEFKQGEVPASLIVPGSYNGWTEAKSAYFDGMTADSQTITVTQNADGTYKVAYTSDTWGEFSFDSVTATSESGNIFKIAGTGTCKMGMEGNLKDYQCTIEGSIDVSKEAPEFTIKVPAVMGGLTIVFSTGDMPATAE